MWVHSIDPYAIGPVRWYGLAYLAGFMVAYFLIRRVLARNESSIPHARAGDLVAALAIGAVVGGRLGYIVFYQPSLLWTFSDELPFWNAIAINRGGMASHGGMIGVILAGWWFARRHGASFLHVTDLAAFAAPLGLFFGRVANFVNGELYGRPVDASFPLAVKFPQELQSWSGARLQGALDAVATKTGLASSVDDILARIQSGDAAVAVAIAPVLTPRHPSQLYEAVLEGLLVFAVLAWLWRKPRRSGVIAAAFAMVYGVVRIIGEQFRLPDAPLFDLGALELTRGQLLSVALLVGGILVFIASRKGDATTRLGGWSRRATQAVLAGDRVSKSA